MEKMKLGFSFKEGCSKELLYQATALVFMGLRYIKQLFQTDDTCLPSTPAEEEALLEEMKEKMPIVVHELIHGFLVTDNPLVYNAHARKVLIGAFGLDPNNFWHRAVVDGTAQIILAIFINTTIPPTPQDFDATQKEEERPENLYIYFTPQEILVLSEEIRRVALTKKAEEELAEKLKAE